MKRFVEGLDRGQATLFPECLDDWVDEDNPVRVIDAFVGALDLAELGFQVEPAETGRPAYHPSALLKLYIYGYLNRAQSSRRLEREACRNVELMWLIGRLVPDHKTVADFRKDNGLAIRKMCARFVELCREMGLLAKASVAIDGSKFKAVNNRDRNFTRAKVERRRAQLEESVARYLSQLDTADRQEPSETLAAKTTRLNEKLASIAPPTADALDTRGFLFLKMQNYPASIPDYDAALQLNDRPATNDFVGIRKVVQICNPFSQPQSMGRPSHGSEITYSHFKVASRRDLAKLAQGLHLRQSFIRIDWGKRRRK